MSTEESSASPARGQAAVQHTRSALTWRCAAVALVLIPANVYWVTQMEAFRYSTHPTTVSLFFNAVFCLLVLAAFNQVLLRFAPRAALTQAELLLIYSLVCIASCVAGHDWVQVLMPVFSWPFWMATPENRWETLFNPDLPAWLTVQDLGVLKGFYQGGDTLYREEIVGAWLGPVALWSLFICALMLVMLGINSIVRKQWLEGEHLACPLINLPVEISEPRPRLFTRKLFWVGFAIAAGIDTYNSLAFHYPVMPLIRIDWVDMAPAFSGRPWNAVGWTPRSFYPFVIGMGYLMPSDFLFSCWFFYIFWKAELVLSAAFGFDQIKEFPFANFQAFGAYALFGIHALYIGRGYLAQVWGRIIAPGEKSRAFARGADEALSYRGAALAILIGLVFLVWFSAAIGLQVWLGVLFFIIYFMLALAITRMRAQFGTPVHDLHFTGPDQILTNAFGTRFFPRSDLIAFAMLYWFNRAYRNHPMPHQMEAMRMQERVGWSKRRLALAVMLATAVATIASFWVSLHLYYDLGARAKGRMFSGESFVRLGGWLAAPRGPNWYAMGAIGVGALFALFLQTMRMRFMWWPFHPLGFAISGSWQMNLVWMPLLIAWILKSIITNYGGHKTYQTAAPIFMGLILGQFVVGSILNIVSIAMHVPSYMFWQ